MGPDAILPYISKACLDLLIDPLQLIVNSMSTTSTYPSQWKLAQIFRIHKSDTKILKTIELYSKILKMVFTKKFLSH